MSALTLDALTVVRHGRSVLRDATLVLNAGSTTMLAGDGSAARTALLQAIAGTRPIAHGRIALDGERVDALRPWQRARRGLTYVEPGRPVFGQLTTEENIRVSAASPAEERAAFELFPELEARRRTSAALLSGGEQQMLVVARAVSRRPKVLLLDGLSIGLAPSVIQRLLAGLRRLATAGTAMFIVDDSAHVARAIADRVISLRDGRLE